MKYFAASGFASSARIIPALKSTASRCGKSRSSASIFR